MKPSRDLDPSRMDFDLVVLGGGSAGPPSVCTAGAWKTSTAAATAAVTAVARVARPRGRLLEKGSSVRPPSWGGG